MCVHLGKYQLCGVRKVPTHNNLMISIVSNEFQFYLDCKFRMIVQNKLKPIIDINQSVENIYKDRQNPIERF